jgi:hypothetical protein
MSTSAIKSHQYTITLYTPEHQKISWDVFEKKSADILSFCNSFITISSKAKKMQEIFSLVPSKKPLTRETDTIKNKQFF